MCETALDDLPSLTLQGVEVGCRLSVTLLATETECERALPTGETASIASFVGHNRQQPRTKRRSGTKARQREVGAHEGLLRHVLALRRVRTGNQRDALRNCLMGSHELLVRADVAALGAGDEYCLLRWPAHHVVVLHRPDRGGSDTTSKIATLTPVSDKWQTLVFDEVDPIDVAGVHWLPVRRPLGIRAFGMNAFAADTGEDVVEKHTEETLGHEETYIVLRGRARFDLDGEQLELASGALVFVRDPSVRRSAVALEDGTMVLAVGGKSGEAYTPSAWEAYFAAERFRAGGDWDGMAADLQAALVEFPDNPGVLYALACATTLAGEHEKGLGYLERSIELDPSQAAWAQKDNDLASLRDLPGFPRAPQSS